jgi:hypothetical protein
MDEGIPVQAALAKVVRATGVKEFAAKVRMASPNVLRAIDRRYNPTQRTLAPWFGAHRCVEAPPRGVTRGFVGHGASCKTWHDS